jgi:hypothetical protein
MNMECTIEVIIQVWHLPNKFQKRIKIQNPIQNEPEEKKKSGAKTNPIIPIPIPNPNPNAIPIPKPKPKQKDSNS